MEAPWYVFSDPMVQENCFKARIQCPKYMFGNVPSLELEAALALLVLCVQRRLI